MSDTPTPVEIADLSDEDAAAVLVAMGASPSKADEIVAIMRGEVDGCLEVVPDPDEEAE